MGMLEGKVMGEVMAIKIAEIGAQGEERTFVIISRDDTWRWRTNLEFNTPQTADAESVKEDE